jgi:hypothetical protein
MLIELLKLKPVKKNTTSLRKEEGIYEQLLHGGTIDTPSISIYFSLWLS